VVFFTGLPGAGKSTLAGAVRALLERETSARVTALDGDVLRREMSADLGFSRADREEHIRRVGHRAAATARAGGIVLCALIAPYDAARKSARALVEPASAFVLVHVATPLAACEARDPKGLYARARAGALPFFTGVSDPYEPPTDADLTIDTSGATAAEAARPVLDYLRLRGLI
jgi:sulfate adenylyltransferase